VNKVAYLSVLILKISLLNMIVIFFGLILHTLNFRDGNKRKKVQELIDYKKLQYCLTRMNNKKRE